MLKHLSSLTCVALDVYTQSRSELVPGHHHSDRTLNKTWGPQDANLLFCLYNTGTGVWSNAKYAQCPAQLITDQIVLVCSGV